MGTSDLNKTSMQNMAAALRREHKTFREISLALDVSESTARKLLIEWQLNNHVEPLKARTRTERCRIMQNQRWEKITQLQSEGKTIGEIAQTLGLSRARVGHLIWQRVTEERAAR